MQGHQAIGRFTKDDSQNSQSLTPMTGMRTAIDRYSELPEIQ